MHSVLLNGQYLCVLVFPYRDCKMVACDAKGKDDEVAKKLWQVSAKMVGLEETT